MAETIAAISTAPGEAGIGIVRTSGPASLDIMKKLMDKCPAEVEPRHAYLGRVVAGSSGKEDGVCRADGAGASIETARAGGGSDAVAAREVIDQAVFIYMKAPHSYTGEDVLEIQAHGSNVGLRRILREVLSSGAAGVRLAEPGEFTKLAFLNGKMDLSQAEAVIDVIKAKTELSLDIAGGQMEGRLGRAVRGIRTKLLDTLSEIAVNIDYPDEDEENTGDGSTARIADDLLKAKGEVDKLLETAAIGRIAREGVRAAIVGKPNAGKSSLMNAILGEGRVIVTDIPGTTRDTVEESASLGGLPIVLIDTAGLRDTEDAVEKIGIERTGQAIETADLVMLVIDSSSPLDEQDEKVLGYLEGFDRGRLLVVLNKTDLGEAVTEEDMCRILPGAAIVKTALKGEDKAATGEGGIGKDAEAAGDGRGGDKNEGAGPTEAARRISEAVGAMHGLMDINVKEMNIVSNERHAALLRNASADLAEAAGILAAGGPLEVAELSARYAYDSLGAIIGEEAGEEIIDNVFSKFCLGK